MSDRCPSCGVSAGREHLSAEAIAAATRSLRTVGGAYDLVALAVESSTPCERDEVDE